MKGEHGSSKAKAAETDKNGMRGRWSCGDGIAVCPLMKVGGQHGPFMLLFLIFHSLVCCATGPDDMTDSIAATDCSPPNRQVQGSCGKCIWVFWLR